MIDIEWMNSNFKCFTLTGGLFSEENRRTPEEMAGKPGNPKKESRPRSPNICGRMEVSTMAG
jgi:hypothetical protein